MPDIKIPAGTSIKKIIDALNESGNSLKTNDSNLRFEDWIYEALPKPLIGLMKHLDSPHKKDTALLCVLTTLSGLIKNYSVEYDGRLEGCQLYLYLLGDPAQGKGSAANYRQLGSDFNLLLSEEYRLQMIQYNLDMEKWKDGDKNGEKPDKPLRRFLFLAANNTKTSMIKDLQGNGGYGLIFETEGDTLYSANKNDFGGFSDILLKGFHGEDVSVSRAGFEDGPIQIEKVILSVFISSTLDQCFRLIPTFDNGLFSRFAPYILPQNLSFTNNFRKKDSRKINLFIKLLTNLFTNIGNANLNSEQKIFTFKANQEKMFHQQFAIINDACIDNGQINLKGNIHRLAVTTIRICMLLTYLRNFAEGSNYNNNEIECNDMNFEIGLSIGKTLFSHVQLLDELYAKKNNKERNQFLIHTAPNPKQYPNSIKNKAIELSKNKVPVTTIAQNLLGNAKLKGTVSKWINSKKGFPVSETETPDCLVIETIKTLKAAKVSFFESVVSNEVSGQFNLYDLITTNKFKNDVIKIRKAQPALAKKLKLKSPAFSPSAIFEGKRRIENLIKHSGFICIDIDAKDNIHISNFKTLKNELKNITNVSFISKSVSGNGYYMLMPISKTSLHERYFEAIKEALLQLNIVIDKGCRDVSRLRIVSYDNDYFISNNTILIDSVLTGNNKKISFKAYDDDQLSILLRKIKVDQIDITKTYDDWFAIACALANTYGEEGRQNFHFISGFYPNYSEKEADAQFTACLKNTKENGRRMGTIFYIARKYGIR